MRLFFCLALAVGCADEPSPWGEELACSKPLSLEGHTIRGSSDARRFCGRFSGTGTTAELRIEAWAGQDPDELDCVCEAGRLVLDVDGVFAVDLTLPRLLRAGDIAIGAGPGSRVSLPRLVQTGTLFVRARTGGGGAFALDVPRLGRVGTMTLTGGLERFPDVSALRQVDVVELDLAPMGDYVGGPPGSVGALVVRSAEGAALSRELPCFPDLDAVVLDGVRGHVATLPVCADSIASLRVSDTMLQELHLDAPLQVRDALTLQGNRDLWMLDGLQLGPEATSLVVHDSRVLPELAGDRLDTLDIEDVEDLGALSGLVEAGSVRLLPGWSYTLAGLDSLRAVDALTLTGDWREIAGLGALEEVGELRIEQTTVLSRLDGLDAPRRVRALHIEGNRRLVDLRALHGLESVDTLVVAGNPLLPAAEAEALRDAIDELGEASISDNAPE